MLVFAKNAEVNPLATTRRNTVSNMKQFLFELDLNDTYTEDYILQRQEHFREGEEEAC